MILSVTLTFLTSCRNLQAAVGSYYDFEQPHAIDLPRMTLVKDITVGEGESVRPNVKFTKTWRIRNIGTLRFFFLLFYTSNWPPYLTDLLSLRLVRALGAGNYMRWKKLILTAGALHD